MTTQALPLSRFHQFAETRQLAGTSGVFKLLVDRLGRRFANLDSNHLVLLDAAAAKIPAELDPEFTFRFLAAEEIVRFARDPALELSDEFAQRVERGRDFCFAALSGDRLAAYGWYALESVEPEHCNRVGMSFPPQMAYMYKGYTNPDFRGRRLHGICMGLALRALGEQGVSQLISTVNWTNWASLRSCERLGYQTVGYLVAYGWRTPSRYWASRAARQLGLRFGSKAFA